MVLHALARTALVASALGFLTSGALAQALTCSPSTLGSRACQAETTCSCEYSTGGTITGKPPGYFWNCSILAAKCTAAPAMSLLNTPGAMPGAAQSSGAGMPSVRQLQSVLKARGFDPGSVDGKMGSRTRRAIEEWQNSVGAPATGKMTVDQWQRLQS
ncbi:MAG: peptidoglycan-binding domain-containing protein [Elstera sp.]